MEVLFVWTTWSEICVIYLGENFRQMKQASGYILFSTVE